jgi:hypothetical protein
VLEASSACYLYCRTIKRRYVHDESELAERNCCTIIRHSKYGLPSITLEDDITTSESGIGCGGIERIINLFLDSWVILVEFDTKDILISARLALLQCFVVATESVNLDIISSRGPIKDLRDFGEWCCVSCELL